jgi:hypothetical protein
MRALVVLVALAGVAHAERIPSGGAWLHYELTGLTDNDAARPHELVLAGARLHGFIGPNERFGFHAGLDLAGGSTIRGAGFAYDVALFPLGIGVRLGRTGVVAIGTGVGAVGAIGRLDDAVTLPVELTVELGGGRLRVLARARAAYLAGADGRQDGAPSTKLADELDAQLGLRIGHHYEDYAPSGNGYFAGVAYREMLGSRYVGAVIGYSIDVGSPR